MLLRHLILLRGDDSIGKNFKKFFQNNMRSTKFNSYVTLNGDVLGEISAIGTENEKYDVDIRAEREQSRKEGRAEGIDKINQLNALLIRNNRHNDLVRSIFR